MRLSRVFAPILAIAVLAACSTTESDKDSSPPTVDISSWASPSPPPSPSHPTFADCPEADVLAAIREQVELGSGRWDSVVVDKCSNGFALAFAHPKPVVGESSERVYLHKSGGGWTVIDSGTGLDCGGAEGEVAEACRQLGLK